MIHVQYICLVFFFLPWFRYMEEVIESTFSLLSYHHEYGLTSPRSEKALEPIHLLALLDIKATWFKKWMVCVANEQIFSCRCACDSQFTLCSTSSLSMGTTVGLWFSDSWRRNTGLWWVIYSKINNTFVLLECLEERNTQVRVNKKSFQQVHSNLHTNLKTRHQCTC